MNIANLYTNDYLNTKRTIGDSEADSFIQQQFEIPQLRADLQTWLSRLDTNEQLVQSASTYVNQSFITNAHILPALADKKLLNQGAGFFAKHAEPIMSLLGLLSLPYCYAAADGAMVLYLSERLRGDTGKRLFETASFVWDVMAPDAFMPSGKGFASILKVRLMHAAGRYYSLKSEHWDSQNGYPINQEDMAGTNLAFSLIVVRGLRKFGFTITHEEQSAFFHLWNVIGHLLGVNDDLLPKEIKQAQILEATIRSRHFKESYQGKELTKSLTDFLTGMNLGSSYTNNELLGMMRYLLGDEIAMMLGLQTPGLSPQKITLLKAVNLINDLKPRGSTLAAYRNAHQKLKRQQGAEKVNTVTANLSR
jgi:hypothetical protein